MTDKQDKTLLFAINDGFPNETVTILKTVNLIIFACLTGFFFFQKQRKRACFEPIITVAILTAYYTLQLVPALELIWVGTENGLVPLGRYYSWLLTWPPQLTQFLALYNKSGYAAYYQQLLFLFIALQLQVVCMAFASVSVDTQKWLFFVASGAAGGTFCFQFYFVYYDQKCIFPEDLKWPIFFIAMAKLLTVVLYAIVWVVGIPGLGYIDRNTDVTINCFLDLLSKGVLSYFIWYVRWMYLESNDVTNTGRILVSRSVNEKGNNKFGLTEEELINAQTTPFHILLLDSDILVQKTVLLMMNEMEVEVSLAFDTEHAVEQLEKHPSYFFDCVIVVPSHHQKPYESQALEEFSKKIVRDPYKIPLLGMDIGNNDGRIQDPGDYIHGIIQRPLDELSFCEDLYNWRVTASMWRRVALAMENIENDEILMPQLEELPEEAQRTMSFQNMTKSMKMRRRGSLFGQTLLNQNPEVLSENNQKSKQEIANEYKQKDSQRWQNVVSNFHAT